MALYVLSTLLYVLEQDSADILYTNYLLLALIFIGLPERHAPRMQHGI